MSVKMFKIERNDGIITDVDGTIFPFQWCDILAMPAIQALDAIKNQVPFPWVVSMRDAFKVARFRVAITGRGKSYADLTADRLKTVIGKTEVKTVEFHDHAQYVTDKNNILKKEIARSYQRTPFGNVIVIEDDRAILEWIQENYQDWPRFVLIGISKDEKPVIIINNREEMTMRDEHGRKVDLITDGDA